MTLDERMRRVEDRTAILELLYEYCRYADTFNADAQAALYTDDCVVSYDPGAPIMRGRAAVHEMLSNYFPDSVSSQHMITNAELLFESDDTVVVHTYMYSWQRFKGFPMAADCHRWGRYENRIVRTGEGWRISRMQLLSAGEYGGARIGEQFGRPWPPRFD